MRLDSLNTCTSLALSSAVVNKEKLVFFSGGEGEVGVASGRILQSNRGRTPG